MNVLGLHPQVFDKFLGSSQEFFGLVCENSSLKKNPMSILEHIDFICLGVIFIAKTVFSIPIKNKGLYLNETSKE